MDKDVVVSYVERQNNEWDATDKAISEAFVDMRVGPGGARTTPDLPFSMFDWRADYYAWGKWRADVKDDYWVGAADYNAAVAWHNRLRQWQARVPELVKAIPSAPIPAEATGPLEDIRDGAAAATSGIGMWVAIGLVGAGIFYGIGSRKS